MIILPSTTDRVAKDSNGEPFIPSVRIAYIDAFYASLVSNHIEFNNPRQYKQHYPDSHDKLVFWLSKNLTGKFSCPPFSFLYEHLDVHFENEQDAILFKIVFS